MHSHPSPVLPAHNSWSRWPVHGPHQAADRAKDCPLIPSLPGKGARRWVSPPQPKSPAACWSQAAAMWLGRQAGLWPGTAICLGVEWRKREDKYAHPEVIFRNSGTIKVNKIRLIRCQYRIELRKLFRMLNLFCSFHCLPVCGKSSEHHLQLDLSQLNDYEYWKNSHEVMDFSLYQLIK